jgi:glycopeptide antibiotics resistance protein
MKQLLLQSKWHWLMGLPIYLICSDKSINPQLIHIVLASLIIGLAVELYQYIREAKIKKKKLNSDYYKPALVDVLITVAGGVVGYYLAHLIHY